MRVLVTGNLGFIGAHFAAWLLRSEPEATVIGFARKGDQRSEARARMLAEAGPGWADRFRQVWGDLTDRRALSGLCEDVDVVVNFAAKTFVDHSLKDPQPFIQSNVLGADALMEDAARYGVRCFVQVSTDEVYGQILQGRYREDAPLTPRNPYAWTKACADLDAVWRHRTYGFPAVITRTENNFGPWQHRQKALPTFVRHALAGQPLPVYGDGRHVRCWLYVEDHCRAIWHLVRMQLADDLWRLEARDRPIVLAGQENERHYVRPAGEIFHVAGEQEVENIELARFVLRTLGRPEDLIRFIPDADARPGHDRRYALDVGKLRATGWAPAFDLWEAMALTVRWYAENPWWTA